MKVGQLSKSLGKMGRESRGRAGGCTLFLGKRSASFYWNYLNTLNNVC